MGPCHLNPLNEAGADTRQRAEVSNSSDQPRGRRRMGGALVGCSGELDRYAPALNEHALQPLVPPAKG